MAMSVQLGDEQRCVQVKFSRVHGEGLVVPRLVISVEIRRLGDFTSVVLHDVTVRLTNGANETLGEGRIVAEEVYSTDRDIEVEVPLSRRAFSYIDATERGQALVLTAQFSGWLSVTRKPDVANVHGETVFDAVGKRQQAWLSFNIARSDWFGNVLQRIKQGEYVAFEFLIPADERNEFKSALAHLNDAYRHYSTGNDPGVFSSCRAALDTLPGAKQRILERVPDKRKRQALDDLLRQAGSYPHSGRHPSEEPESDGGFPVDHRDAEFALRLMQVLVMHIGKLLGEEAA